MALLKQVYAIHPAQSTTIKARVVWFILDRYGGPNENFVLVRTESGSEL